MRKLILSLILTIICISGYPNDKLKQSKEFTDIVLFALTTGNTYGYYFPLQTLVDENNPNIIYQSYIEPLNSGLMKFKVSWNDNNTVSISYYNNRFFLKWANGKIAQFSESNTSSYLFSCFYNSSTGKLQKILQQSKNNPKMNIYTEFDYAGDAVSKTTIYHFDKKDKFVNYVKNFSYLQDTVTFNIASYSYGPKKKLKAMKISNSTYEYSRNDSNEYSVYVDGKFQIESRYDDNGLLIKSKSNFNGSNYFRKYTYCDGKLFSKMEEKYTDGKFLERSIYVSFSLNVQDENIPIYERMEGTYKFDESGDLIWEQRNTKYRKKINDRWTDWIQMIY